MKRIIALLSLCLCFPFAFNVTTAKANSGPPFWGGGASQEASILEGNCPIVVEKELLVFDLYEYPTTSGEFIKKSSVTAKYNFFNPMDYDIDVTLAFPVGTMTNSGYGFDDVKILDNSLYSVKIDGVEKNIVKHYTPRNYSGGYSIDMGFMCKLLKSDLQIDSNTPIYTYFFKNTLEESRKVKVTIPNASKNQIIYSDKSSLNKQLIGKDLVAYGGASNYQDFFKIVVIGDKPEELIVEYYNASGYSIEGELLQDEERGVVEGKFSELVDECYNPETSPFTKEEYGNSLIDVLKCGQIKLEEGEEVYIDQSHVDGAIVWVVYEMYVGAMGRVVNEITVPMYPVVLVQAKPYAYQYKYYLSPAQGWADFGELEIVINTNYYLIGSPGIVFNKVENGYAVTLDGLPEGELIFSLCESQTRRNSYGCKVSVYNDTLPLIGVLSVLVVYSIMRKKRGKTGL